MAAQLIVDTALALDEDGEKFFAGLSKITDQIDAPILYRNAWEVAPIPSNLEDEMRRSQRLYQYGAKLSSEAIKAKTIPVWLEQVLLRRLNRDGYIIGTVVTGRFVHAKKGPTTQMEVRDGNNTYIYDNMGHRYWATTGDSVIIQVREATVLSSRNGNIVKRAHFVPARTNRDD